MIYNNIEELRKILIEELKNVDSNNPIKLPYDKDLIYQLIFKNNRICKMPFLEKIDLSDIDFSGIDITNFDFTGLHGVKINPQTIKNKDLSDTILNGVEFIGSFYGVAIKNTDFTGSKGAVIDPDNYRITFKGSKFADVTFIGSFKDVEIAGADFTGSKGAVIDLQLISYKDARSTKFADTIIKGSFNGVKVSGADFTNAYGIKKLFKYEKGVKINQSKVYQKDISYMICDGVIFTGSFDDVFIRGTNFTGSKNACIYTSLIKDNDMTETICKDVKFLETIENNEKIARTNFTGSINAKVNPQGIYKNDIRKTICDSVEFVNIYSDDEACFKDVKVSGTDFTGSIGVIINPQEVYQKDFSETRCANVTFTGPFNGVNIYATDFTGSKGAKIDPRVTLHTGSWGNIEYGLYKTICTDAEIVALPNVFERARCVLDGCIYGVEIVKKVLNDIMDKYKDSSSNVIRTKVVEELKKYNGRDKILLPFDEETIKLILFDEDKFAKEFEGVLEKIDFSNVDFSGIDVSGIDFSKYKRVTLNLETIKNKDISNCNLKGVRLIGSFEGVNETNAILKGAYYEEQSFETDFREKIKVLTLTK